MRHRKQEQITHNKASRAIPDLRALARRYSWPRQNSSNVVRNSAQTILRKSSKWVFQSRIRYQKDPGT